MNRRNMLAISATTVFGLALLADGAIGAPKATIKKGQLVGDWALVSNNTPNAAIQNDPDDGYLVFERNGRFSFAILSSKGAEIRVQQPQYRHS
jgi:hypothetical protein